MHKKKQTKYIYQYINICVLHMQYALVNNIIINNYRLYVLLFYDDNYNAYIDICVCEVIINKVPWNVQKEHVV